ncbi:MAG: twin-arginine translocation pathway signal protein [Sphingomonas bacterium]|uniref:murein L,D-transpeptidase catalytic domain family protein n=1 Tax=Sphingomonas bacterium TaxID=1895847 RepID=UPI002637F2AA|nr:murein L,D-transpeptidase catalytic domain family protein [Sphingomonas bacterium]MDB5706015.1 twin-arginine translocation pathway signal protein [Sphingomonas bacterium]
MSSESGIVLEQLGAPSRRMVMRGGLQVAGALTAAILVPGVFGATAAAAAPLTSPRMVRPELLAQAIDALARHGDAIPLHDRLAIADFAAPSAEPRFHLVDLASGDTTTLRVAHGSGSDPLHTGWLQQFSNDEGSNASSEGAFLTDEYYDGKHGLSQRLIGLDPTNCNALDRAIVIHSAWYANPDMLETYGQLGRSQGCFAVGEADLALVFERLGPGRMVFSAKV